MSGQLAAIVAVALYGGLFVAAGLWARAGRRRDSGQGRGRGRRRDQRFLLERPPRRQSRQSR